MKFITAAKISTTEKSATIALSQKLVNVRSQNGLNYVECRLRLSYDNIYDSAIVEGAVNCHVVNVKDERQFIVELLIHLWIFQMLQKILKWIKIGQNE